jgi:zinc transporter 1/2/3
VHGAVMILIFSLATPVGVIIGLILLETAVNGIEGVFSAIATGTFLYIAASEIVVEEFSVSKYTGYKFLCFLVG